MKPEPVLREQAVCKECNEECNYYEGTFSNNTEFWGDNASITERWTLSQCCNANVEINYVQKLDTSSIKLKNDL